MFRYFKRNLPFAIAALSISILTQLCAPLAALMEQKMIDLVTLGNMKEFQNMLGFAGCIVFASALLYFLNALTQKRFQVSFEEDLRNDLFVGIMRQSKIQFSEKDTSEQISFVKSHASTIANNLTQPIFILVSYGLMGLVVILIMLYYSPTLAVISVVCALFSAIQPLCFNRKLGNQLLNKLDKDAELTFQLKESLNGHETITAFEVFPHIMERFTRANYNMAEADYKMQATVSLLENISRVMQKLSWFLSFLLAGGMAVRGDITVGTMVMFITLFGEFNSCVTLFAQTIPLLLSTRPDIKKMLEIIDCNETEFNGRDVPSFATKIETRNLSFGYADDAPVIKQLNITIRKNEKIALIGASGCGKSTLVKLISGSYANYTGTICFDDTELHELDIKKLRKLVTVIHQNTFIFNDTIRFNICLGETFPDGELEKALHFSGVERFLHDVYGGVDGVCGENGSQLSGGQKQRIALARALIRGVNVLVLDEGVSAIDVETANEIEQELLQNGNLTLLTVTHRIKDGLIAQYDRVLMMKEGILEERNWEQFNV